MAKYSYITDKTHNNRKIQVESAKRDGSGKNIENNYAKQNGNYQSLTAGLSNNFDTKQVMADESAYNFRPTATMGSVELEVGSPCKVKKIVGGSVALNQSYNFGSNEITTNGVLTKDNNNKEYHFVGADNNDNKEFHRSALATIGHKILTSFSYKSSYGFRCQSAGGNFTLSQSNDYVMVSKIQIGATPYISGGSFSIYWFNYEGNNANWDLYIKNPQVFDLTQMFGSTIADYIYSLEQANAGSGVAWFKRYFPKEYYAYNSGELVSVKTRGKKITHFNQWDEEWELGTYNVTTGEKESDNSKIRSKNKNKILPNTIYRSTNYGRTGDSAYLNILFYDANENFISKISVANNTFVTPANASYLTFYCNSAYGTTYNHDICINFHYDGERDGEYEPYNSETYACDDIELRGIPQLDENNNLAFDGDEYANDGNVTRKYGIVDLGTLEWEYDSEYQRFNCTSNITNMQTGIARAVELLCAIYEAKYNREAFNINWNMVIYNSTNLQRVSVHNHSYTDPTTFKNAMSGVYLLYPLATTTDENSIPFTEVQECDNCGTEEWLAPTTDTRPCEVPVGHETDYLPDLKAKLEVAPATPNENGVYVMEHNASGNTYTLLGAWLSDNGYVKPTSISGYDNTKTQTLKNVEGVLTWVDDE